MSAIEEEKLENERLRLEAEAAEKEEAAAAAAAAEEARLKEEAEARLQQEKEAAAAAAAAAEEEEGRIQREKEAAAAAAAAAAEEARIQREKEAAIASAAAEEEEARIQQEKEAAIAAAAAEAEARLQREKEAAAALELKLKEEQSSAAIEAAKRVAAKLKQSEDNAATSSEAAVDAAIAKAFAAAEDLQRSVQKGTTLSLPPPPPPSLLPPPPMMPAGFQLPPPPPSTLADLPPSSPARLPPPPPPSLPPPPMMSAGLQLPPPPPSTSASPARLPPPPLPSFSSSPKAGPPPPPPLPPSSSSAAFSLPPLPPLPPLLPPPPPPPSSLASTYSLPAGSPAQQISSPGSFIDPPEAPPQRENPTTPLVVAAPPLISAPPPEQTQTVSIVAIAAPDVPLATLTAVTPSLEKSRQSTASPPAVSASTSAAAAAMQEELKAARSRRDEAAAIETAAKNTLTNLRSTERAAATRIAALQVEFERAKAEAAEGVQRRKQQLNSEMSEVAKLRALAASARSLAAAKASDMLEEHITHAKAKEAVKYETELQKVRAQRAQALAAKKEDVDKVMATWIRSLIDEACKSVLTLLTGRAVGAAIARQHVVRIKRTIGKLVADVVRARIAAEKEHQKHPHAPARPITVSLSSPSASSGLAHLLAATSFSSSSPKATSDSDVPPEVSSGLEALRTTLTKLTAVLGTAPPSGFGSMSHMATERLIDHPSSPLNTLLQRGSHSSPQATLLSVLGHHPRRGGGAGGTASSPPSSSKKVSESFLASPISSTSNTTSNAGRRVAAAFAAVTSRDESISNAAAALAKATPKQREAYFASLSPTGQKAAAAAALDHRRMYQRLEAEWNAAGVDSVSRLEALVSIEKRFPFSRHLADLWAAASAAVSLCEALEEAGEAKITTMNSRKVSPDDVERLVLVEDIKEHEEIESKTKAKNATMEVAAKVFASSSSPSSSSTRSPGTTVRVDIMNRLMKPTFSRALKEIKPSPFSAEVLSSPKNWKNGTKSTEELIEEEDEEVRTSFLEAQRLRAKTHATKQLSSAAQAAGQASSVSLLSSLSKSRGKDPLLAAGDAGVKVAVSSQATLSQEDASRLAFTELKQAINYVVKASGVKNDNNGGLSGLSSPYSSLENNNGRRASFTSLTKSALIRETAAAQKIATIAANKLQTAVRGDSCGAFSVMSDNARRYQTTFVSQAKELAPALMTTPATAVPARRASISGLASRNPPATSSILAGVGQRQRRASLPGRLGLPARLDKPSAFTSPYRPDDTTFNDVVKQQMQMQHHQQQLQQQQQQQQLPISARKPGASRAEQILGGATTIVSPRLQVSYRGGGGGANVPLPASPPINQMTDVELIEKALQVASLSANSPR